MDWKKEYKKWRERAKKGLPALAVRVFALREKSYIGCGFHYDLEAQLGWMIFILNSPDHFAKDFPTAIIQEITLEGVYKDVTRIENELKNN